MSSPSDEAPSVLTDAEWELMPFHMQGALSRYLSHGIGPGSFLEAVLCNDLSGAVTRADAINRVHLANIVNFLQWHVPAICWGSEERYNAWVMRGGLEGHEKVHDGARGEDAGDTSPPWDDNG